MLHLLTPGNTPPFRRLLCLGAHSDDIEIGCGGTMLKLLHEYSDLSVHWVVFSSGEERAREARASADRFLEGAEKKNVVVRNFRTSFFPYEGLKIKECFEAIKDDFSPDIIFTHYGKDLHQDHRVLSELTWNTFRSHLILEYEIPKYDGGLGSPNVFVHLDEPTCRKKVEIILESFRTQAEKQWFSADAFLSLLRLRGIESDAPTRYAEAFYCRKLVLL